MVIFFYIDLSIKKYQLIFWFKLFGNDMDTKSLGI